MHGIENKKFGINTFAPLITYQKIEVVRVHMTSKISPPNFGGGVKFWPLGGGVRIFFSSFEIKLGMENPVVVLKKL